MVVLLYLLVAAKLAGAPGELKQTSRVSMRDGVRLSTTIYLPDPGGRFPVILVRTPYGKGRELSRNYAAFLSSGYAVVVQDVRGRYESEGVFDPLRQEITDGDDTLTWIARQPWSTGRIGMVGGSYVGIVQWKAALSGNPYLKAISPVVAGSDDYEDRYYSRGGGMKLGHRLLWMSFNMRHHQFKRPDFNFFVKTLPVEDADIAATGQRIPMYRDVLAHPSYDAFWRSLSTREALDRMRVPVFNISGWYDNFVDNDLEAFARLRSLGRVVQTLIGPWPHNMSIPLTGIDLGGEAGAPVLAMQIDWFDRWLKGKDASATFKAPLRIFVMGANVWRDEHEWPLRRALATPLYLTSRKGANGLDGDGQLQWAPPRRRREDTYLYDPREPVPTRGGNVCCNPQIFPWGPLDQRAVEQRADVLVYTSPALKSDLEVTGPVRAVLHVATSARDTDFMVKLVDVHPDGRALNVCDGMLRLRFREGLDKQVLAEPGTVYPVTVYAGVTSNVFRAGHRIRLEVASSNFPRFDRNLNSGGPVAREKAPVVARQSVFSGGVRSSHLLLPVVR